MDESDLVYEKLIRVPSFLFDCKCLYNKLTSKCSPCSKLIISEEEISGNIHTFGNGGFVAKEMADRIYSTFSKSQILIFIRNQVDIIESSYKQYVRIGGTYNINDYLFQNKSFNYRYPTFDFRHFEYGRLISYYQKLFSKNNVFVYLYEDFEKHNDKFIKKLTDDLCISHIDLSLIRINKGLLATNLNILRIINKFTNTYSIYKDQVLYLQIYNTVLKILRSIDNRIQKHDIKTFISKNIKNYIEQYYVESNTRLKKIINHDISYHNYP